MKICLVSCSGGHLFQLYEGFALTALEAMACGTPAITSNTSSLPEVVGDAAIKVNRSDTNQLANAIYKVLINKKLQTQMVKKGFERVKKYSWEKTCEKIIEICNLLLTTTDK